MRKSDPKIDSCEMRKICLYLTQTSVNIMLKIWNWNMPEQFGTQSLSDPSNVKISTLLLLPYFQPTGNSKFDYEFPFAVLIRWIGVSLSCLPKSIAFSQRSSYPLKAGNPDMTPLCFCFLFLIIVLCISFFCDFFLYLLQTSCQYHVLPVKSLHVIVLFLFPLKK